MGKTVELRRKRNRLLQYDYGQNGAYFVTICTKNRRHVLSEIVGDDAHIVLKPYGRVVQRFIEHVDEIKTYVIMPNHIHMLIQIDNGAMWASPPYDIGAENHSVSENAGDQDDWGFHFSAVVFRSCCAKRTGFSGYMEIY